MKAVEDGFETFGLIMQGVNEGLTEAIEPLFRCMSEDINNQRSRIGGNWAIAQAVFARASRDFLREKLGPDLVFIVMSMTSACQMKRLEQRHGDGLGGEFVNMLNAFTKVYEPAGEDELNAFNLVIEEEMTREDVLVKVQEILDQL